MDVVYHILNEKDICVKGTVYTYDLIEWKCQFMQKYSLVGD